MGVIVKHPGVYSTLQDLGRYSGLSLGVPISGAMDLCLFNFANQCLHNEPNSAAIEFYQQGLELQFEAPTLVCIASLSAAIQINGTEASTNVVLKLHTNDVLKIKELREGNWGYVAVKGGFCSESYLGSQSFYKAFSTAQLNKKDRIDFNHRENLSIETNLKLDKSTYSTKVLRVFQGPEFNKLNRTLEHQLFNAEFSVSSIQNRMAYQVQEQLSNALDEIITGPVLPGTVQFTPSGKMIILMRDAQVTGGYPRILQLCEESINVLAQKRAKSKIKFKLTEINSENV